jgi:hypothetical protein
MSISPGSVAWKLSFQISPIILTGGIAQSIPGGMLPLISITEAANFVTGLLSGGSDIDLDDFFAHFQPMGASLIDNDIGTYPFANQFIAANAIIFKPLSISMMMICPARDTAGYYTKFATMMALQATLMSHNSSGGLYTVATPSYPYNNCVMTGMRDISGNESKQPQIRWQLDFVQPLVTLQQAAQAQNSLMSQISAGVPTDGSLSGGTPPVGSTTAGIGPAVVPAGQSPVASGIQAAPSVGQIS